MDYHSIAEQIIKLSGGKDNFAEVTNCMTRVRIKYRDESKVDKEGIKQIQGVLGVNEAETFQIIVGPGKSVKVKEEMEGLRGISEPESSDLSDSLSEIKKKTSFLKTLSSIFVPVIPAIIASGILQGINNIFTTTAGKKAAELGIEGVDKLSATQVVLQSWHLLQVSTVLGIIGSATFGFLAIYVGITAAKQFKTDPILGGLIGAMTLSSSLGILGLTAGQGGLFGVILGVWIFSKIMRGVRKAVPDILDVILTPTISVLLTAIIYFSLIMPVTGLLSKWLIDGILFLLETTGAFGGFVFAALAPTMISTGLHHGLTPINMEIINATGSTPLVTIQIMSNPGLVGAGLAIYFMTKSKQVKEIAKAALPTTFLAVGEPTMYGIVIPSGFGFITASIGAGIGGALIRVLDVQASAMGAAGMSAIPLIADGKYLQYLLCYAIACAAAFALTYVVGKARHYE